MAYCPSCGSAVEGKFCPKCGTAVGGPPPNPPNPGYTPGPAPAATTGGMADNMAGALCYLVGFITGIIFLVLEPYNKHPFVKFHAWQSILFCVAWFIFSLLLNIVMIPLALGMHGLWLLFAFVRMVIGLGGFLLWLFLMYKAYNNEKFMLPIVGPIAEKQSHT